MDGGAGDNPGLTHIAFGLALRLSQAAAKLGHPST
jgi:hypothetical protein